MSNTKQYRAVVTCTEDSWCSFCRRPVADHPQALVHDDYDDALQHGRAMSRNVYGASAHRVTVECREVSPWRPSERRIELDHLMPIPLGGVNEEEMT